MASPELPSFYGQRTKDGLVVHPQSNNLTEQPNARDMEPGDQIDHSSQEKPLNAPKRPHPATQNRHPSFKSPFQNGSHPENEPVDDDYNGERSYETFRRQSKKQRPGQMRRMYSVQSVVGGGLPWTQWMASPVKNHFVAFVGEFIGTTLFLFFAFAGTQVANVKSVASNQSTTGADTGFNPTVYLYIALCFGFSLMVNAWIFFRISGGLFNPAVTLALCLLKAIGPIRAICVFLAQLTGACFASYLVKVIFPTPLNVRTTLGEGTTVAQGIFIEAICTAELVFTIIMLAMEKHRATFIAPVGIGLALFVGELVGVYYTGGSLNPARSFGPAAVTHTFGKHDWIYWVGPLIGSLFAVGFYWFIRALEYEMANPGQDSDIKTPKRVKANDPTQIVDEGVAGLSPQTTRGI